MKGIMENNGETGAVLRTNEQLDPEQAEGRSPSGTKSESGKTKAEMEKPENAFSRLTAGLTTNGNHR
jgi:hypothetical protein